MPRYAGELIIPIVLEADTDMSVDALEVLNQMLARVQESMSPSLLVTKEQVHEHQGRKITVSISQEEGPVSPRINGVTLVESLNLIAEELDSHTGPDNFGSSYEWADGYNHGTSEAAERIRQTLGSLSHP